MPGASLEDTSEFALEEAGRITQSAVAYLAFLNHDESVLNMFSWSKAALDQCQMDEKPVVFPVATTGLLGEAVRQRREVITNDYSAPSPYKKGLPEGHVPLSRHLSVPVFDEDRIVALIGVGNKKTDYTESDVRQLKVLMNGLWQTLQQRRAVDALRQSEELHRLMFENNPQPMIVYDLETLVVLAVNDAALDMYGYSREEALSKKIKDIYLPEDLPTLADTIARISSGIAHAGVWRHRRKDGTIIYVEITSHGIMYFQRKARFVLMNDITYRKKIEENLLRTEKLESLGVLAGGLAHDFNNLLTAILGNISLAKTYIDSHKTACERLQEAERASLRARDLTQQLLTFSRGGTPLKETISLEKVIMDSATFALRGSKSRVEFLIPADLWPVEADETQISQVVQNLIINADQAMPRGGVIQIHCQNVCLETQEILPLKQGKYAEISIADHGIGIPHEQIDKIFDPYFTTKQKGSGLGLTTSYSIIKRHDGDIIVDSILGIGTTFHIYLPASNLKIQKMRSEHTQIIPGMGRILVMDDEEMVRQVARSMLQRLGYEVETARDGADAVLRYSKAREQGCPFDAVIMDLTVPGGMGGKEAIQVLRKMDPEIKAIVSSGYSNDPVMATFREHGFTGVVIKPYTISALGETIHALLTSKK